MRKILPLVAFSYFLFCSDLQAQDSYRKSELTIGAGVFTSLNVLSITEDLITSTASFGTIDYRNESSSPAIGLNYRLFTSKHFGLFGEVYYQTIKKEIYQSSNQSKQGDLTQKFLTAGIGAEYRYIRKKWFSLYSNVSLAFTSENDDYSSSSDEFEDKRYSYFNYHLSALGIRIGNRLGISAEAGFGYKGILHGGLSYRF